ncbi:hypothetical protein ACO0OE_001429 [Hanseniaspora uvarum]
MSSNTNGANALAQPRIEIRGKPDTQGKRLVKKVKKIASPFIRTDYVRRQYLKTKNKFKRDSNKKKLNKDNEKETKVVLNNSDDEYDEFPLRAIKFDEIANVKTNILKFQTNKVINVEKDFHLPVRLHRKDTRNLQFQLTRAEIVQRQKEIIEYKKKLQEEESKLQQKRITTQEGDADSDRTSENTDSNNNFVPLGKSMIQKMMENQNPSTTASPSSTPADEVDSASLRPSEAGKVIYDGKEGFINSELNMDNEENSNADVFDDVAPDGGARVRRGGWFGKRKTRQLKKYDEHAKKLRFEEFYPWVLEDFDGYNTWVGTYEAGNSDHYVMFSVEKDGSFTMLPCDKVYRFTARSQFATLTIEEAEKRFEKKRQSVPRWLMKHLDDIGTTTTRYDRTLRKLKGVDGDNHDNQDDEGNVFKRETSDNEIDFDDDFQDDEEAPIMDGNDQENKETEQRMKKEMLQANAMGLRDHEDIIDELDAEDNGEVEDKSIKNTLKKTDMGVLYDSDDEEENPYLSKSDIEDEEKEKEEQNKVKAEEKSDTEKLKSPDKKVRKPRKVKTTVRKHKNNVIVIKTQPDILKKFPLGEWYPKPEEDSKLNISPSKQSSLAVSNKTASPTPEDSLTEELREEDIINIISANPGKLTLKDLIKELKQKVVMNADNKAKMKVLIKQLVKLNNGFLELASTNKVE